MSRIQLSINVSDFDAAVAFYSRLFGATPAKLQPGYATSPSTTRRSSWC
jgi:catechol 2,3-dioxygenase-like lactoylglutathione lyase family enzyme